MGIVPRTLVSQGEHSTSKLPSMPFLFPFLFLFLFCFQSKFSGERVTRWPQLQLVQEDATGRVGLRSKKFPASTFPASATSIPTSPRPTTVPASERPTVSAWGANKALPACSRYLTQHRLFIWYRTLSLHRFLNDKTLYKSNIIIPSKVPCPRASYKVPNGWYRIN